MGSFTQKFADGSQVSGSYSWTWTPPPAVPPMLVGNAAGAAPGKGPEFTRYPGQQTCTLFNGPGAGINAAAFRAVPSGVYPVVCVKDVDYDPATVKAMLNGWLNGVDRRCALVPHHEPKPDETAALYAQRANVAYDVIDAHPNGHLVDKGCKFGGWNQADDYQGWLTGRETWVGWDIYSQSATAYPDPVKFISAAVASAKYAGLPFALTEFNVLRITSDPTGAGRARFLAAVWAQARQAQAFLVQVWDGTGSKGQPFGLNPLEYEVWRTLTGVAAQ